MTVSIGYLRRQPPAIPPILTARNLLINWPDLRHWEIADRVAFAARCSCFSLDDVIERRLGCFVDPEGLYGSRL